AVYQNTGIDLTGSGEPERVDIAIVTEDYFQVIGTDPMLGRTPTPEEHKTGRTQVAVISHRLWQKRFGGDPGAVGRSITVGGAPLTIIGIMPQGSQWPT